MRPVHAPFTRSVKIATFNINNINKRLANLLAWLEREKPDVVCLQELKTEQHFFPADTLRSIGYEAVWVGERSWNGVAILAREQPPILTRLVLPGDENDHQARYVEAAVRGLIVGYSETELPLSEYEVAEFLRQAKKVNLYFITYLL